MTLESINCQVKTEKSYDCLDDDLPLPVLSTFPNDQPAEETSMENIPASCFVHLAEPPSRKSALDYRFGDVFFCEGWTSQAFGFTDWKWVGHLKISTVNPPECRFSWVVADTWIKPSSVRKTGIQATSVASEKVFSTAVDLVSAQSSSF